MFMLGIFYLVLAWSAGYLFLKLFLPGVFRLGGRKSFFGADIPLKSWIVPIPAAFIIGTLLLTWLAYLVSYAFAWTGHPLLFGNLIVIPAAAALVIWPAIAGGRHRAFTAWMQEAVKSEDQSYWVKNYPELLMALTLPVILAYVVLICLIDKLLAGAGQYGSILVLVLLAAAISYLFFFKRGYLYGAANLSKDIFKRIRKFWLSNRLESVLVLAATVVWSFFMFYSFRVENGSIRVGASVYSDFGPHMAMIRSFTRGANIPTSYPHFPDSHIRYHFMFHFLAGNLEYLGLPIDWAFNLPSILSFTAFIMLLYALTVVVLGSRKAGVLTAVFFFFRSSFAFFTFLGDRLTTAWIYFHSIFTNPASFWYNAGNFLNYTGGILTSILTNKDHIGKTQCENWGLWAQKTFVNQRHFPFALGMMMLIILLLLPLMQEMIAALRRAGGRPSAAAARRKEFFLSVDAWEPGDMGRSLVIGILLGLLSFWNGAVVVGILPVLCMMALFSKHRMEYLNIAICAVLLTYIEGIFLMGSGISSIQPKLVFGFLANEKTLPGVLAYYAEVFGLMPLAALAGIFLAPKGTRWLALAFFMPVLVATTVQITPDMPVNHKYVMMSVMLLNMFAALLICRLMSFGRVTALTAPVAEQKNRYAVTLQPGNVLSPDEAHVLGIEPGMHYPVSGWMAIKDGEEGRLETVFSLEADLDRKTVPAAAVAEEERTAPARNKWRKIFTTGIAVFVFLMMTVTGAVDLITLYNMDKLTYTISLNDPVTEWATKNTRPGAVFLTYIHVTHPLLMAGRKIFYGWPYFAYSAGYNTTAREQVVKEIYGCGNPDRIKELLRTNHIDYVVVENENRTCSDYILQEQVFKDNFPVVYDDPSRGITIYQAPGTPGGQRAG
ncbi:MAG: hypothetical protein ACM3WV_00185 [Bacillota bacterium]